MVNQMNELIERIEEAISEACHHQLDQHYLTKCARAVVEEIENGGSPCGVCGCLVYKGLPTK